MNISLEQIDKVSAVLTVQVEKADYASRVEASLKDFRKQATMPGFRPGQVPMGLLKKRFGKGVMAEEVQKLVGEKMYEYIRENKLDVLGEPLPSEDRQQDVDFDTKEDFSFAFDIALSPEFEVSLSSDDKIDYYDIQVGDQMVDNQVKMYTRNSGGYEKVDSYEPKDLVKGLLAELDENGNTKEGGIQVENAILSPEYIKVDDQKAIFDGCKVNDVLVFNPAKAYAERGAELASLLKVSREEAEGVTADFSFQVQEITRFKEAELTQELFDSVFPGESVKSEDEFRSRIRKIMAEQFAEDSDYKFILDLRTYLLDKVGKLEYPEKILKRFLQLSSEKRGEKFDEDGYDKQIVALTWQLIRQKLVETYNIKVERADMKETAKNFTKIQFAQYGMINIPEEFLERQAEEMLKKEDQTEQLFERAIDAKLAATLKNVVTLDKKETSVEDFNKLFG